MFERIPSNALIRRLELFAPLSDDDRSVLEDLTASSRRVDAGVPIVRAGDQPKVVHLVLSGLVCRYKNLVDGKRQILGYMVPGDFCNLHAFILDEIDYNIVVMSQAAIVDITPAQKQS